MHIDLPKESLNWQCSMEKIKYPRGAKAITKCGNVYLFKHGKNFGVAYGLDIKSNLSHHGAAMQFGMAVLHEAQCGGRI